MKKILIAIFIFSLLFVGCSDTGSEAEQSSEEALVNTEQSQVESSESTATEQSGASGETSSSTPISDVPNISVEDCIAMLNKVYHSDFEAMYSTAEEDMLIAVYQSGEAFENGEEPLMMLGLNEPIPEEYYIHPYEYTYSPVRNYQNKAEINEKFSPYLTEQYIKSMKWRLDNNFIEFEDELYIAHGGIEYQSFSIDFGSIDYADMLNHTLTIKTFYRATYNGTMMLKFAEEDGTLKIDSDHYILMYPLYNLDSDFEYIEIPDFLAFTSENDFPTPYEDFTASETQPPVYTVTYLGDYYEDLPEYANLLKLLGFTAIMDGYEGFYSFEKYEGDYIITVNAYYLNEEDGVQVEVGITYAVG